jgi:prepilin-type N-terminal cleavage/methylation domain-containing protein
MNHPRTHLVRFLRGFSLLELLVAMAILSMLMTMMFSLLGGTISLWEIGNKRIEAAQTARVGLNIIANDLRRAISDQQVSYTTNGTAITNTVPFFATNYSTNTIDLGVKAANADGSGQLFGVLATGKTNQPFEEFGYLCAYLGTDDGTNMVGNKYYLVRKYSTNNNADFSTNKADFYLQGNATTNFATNSDAFFPIIENCVRMEFSYPVTNASGGIDFTNTWNSQTNLPLGVLVSVWVLDSRTADKIAAIPSCELSSQQINSITNATPSTDPVDRLLQRGAVRMRRFIPLNQH